MNIIIMGPPGSGKGTQSQLLCEKFGFRHLSTGEVLRAAVKAQTELGNKAQAIMQSGALVPDGLVVQMVSDWMAADSDAKGVIFDGFPRTVLQAKAMENLALSPDALIHLDTPHDVIIKRLSGRRIHLDSGRIYHLEYNPPAREGVDDVTGEPLVQREDDRPESIEKRLQAYQEQTEPVLHYYSASGRHLPLLTLTGAGAADAVGDQLADFIHGLRQASA